MDFVRVPGVIKLRNGAYSSLSLHMDISQVLDIRASIIQHTAEVFEPDLFIVDKEPLGLRGEIHDTLRMLKAKGTRLVLGLRDVMDDPELLAKEWARKEPVPALRELYDDILVYGVPEVCNPLDGLDLPDDVLEKVRYTGYLRSHRPKDTNRLGDLDLPDEPYVLVTPGGGGDGEELVDWVLRAYEEDIAQAQARLPHAAMLVFGPFMRPRRRQEFEQRVARLPRVSSITFDAQVERLMAGSKGVVAMGGYNTFCDILSFDKPAVIVPRRRPRMEQYIRASRAQALGLLQMLSDEKGRDTALMREALCTLEHQDPPSRHLPPKLLKGLENVQRMVDGWLAERAGRLSNDAAAALAAADS